jgi:hypothetical protein
VKKYVNVAPHKYITLEFHFIITFSHLCERLGLKVSPYPWLFLSSTNVPCLEVQVTDVLC